MVSLVLGIARSSQIAELVVEWVQISMINLRRLFIMHHLPYDPAHSVLKPTAANISVSISVAAGNITRSLSTITGRDAPPQHSRERIVVEH